MIASRIKLDRPLDSDEDSTGASAFGSDEFIVWFFLLCQKTNYISRLKSIASRYDVVAAKHFASDYVRITVQLDW